MNDTFDLSDKIAKNWNIYLDKWTKQTRYFLMIVKIYQILKNQIKLMKWLNLVYFGNSKFCLIDLWHGNSAKVHYIKSNTPTFTTNSIVKLANAWLFYTLVPTIHIDSWLESPPLWEFLSFSSVLYNFLLKSVVCMHSVTILLQNRVYDLLHLSSSIKI